MTWLLIHYINFYYPGTGQSTSSHENLLSALLPAHLQLSYEIYPPEVTPPFKLMLHQDNILCRPLRGRKLPASAGRRSSSETFKWIGISGAKRMQMAF